MKDLYECKNPIIEVSGVGTTVKIDLWLVTFFHRRYETD